MKPIENITNFLTDLGFTLRVVSTPFRSAFIPGIYIDGMTLLINFDTLQEVGDILHEAGHVAVMPSMFRSTIHGDVDSAFAASKEYLETHDFIDENCVENPICRALIQCGESEAMAWSYAAAVAADIEPRLVFHSAPRTAPDGKQFLAYEGEGEEIVVMFQMGAHYGVHGLQAAKMTTVRTFPKMIRWLQV
jgi:hypothetical protein